MNAPPALPPFPPRPSPFDAADAARRFYDLRAEAFDATRDRPWTFVEEHLASLGAGRLLDAGCGNGRHARLAAAHGRDVVAVDVSRALLDLARRRAAGDERRPTFAAADALRLPLRDGAVGHALLLAVLHHVPTRRLRRRALAETFRVLGPGGTLLVSCWLRPHPERPEGTPSATTRLLGRLGVRSPALRAAGLFEPGDAWVPWGPGGDGPARFVHFATPAELRRDLTAAGFAVERCAALRVASARGPDNAVARARKPS